jgi:hypothetical protein
MSTNKINRLTDELLVGYIEGNLSKEDAKRVELLIKSSDENFARFSALYTSYREFQDLELEVTPDTLIQKVQAELGITNKKAASHKANVIKDFINNVQEILKPRVAVYALISTALVIVTIFTIYFQSDDETELQPKRDTEFFNKIMYPDMRPATHSNIKGIEVRLEEDVLTITQPFRFDREIIIYSEERELILSEKFREMDHKILLPETLKGDSIHIVITSLDTVVYKTIFHYQ